MNPVERLKDDLATRFPEVKTSIDPPLIPEKGNWILDIELPNKEYAIFAWVQRKDEFVATMLNGDEWSYSPHEVFKTEQEAVDQITTLIIGAKP